MRLVLDATPLIHLTKVGFHVYFDALGIELVTTDDVLKEAKGGDSPDTEAIKNLIESGKIKVENPKRMKPEVKGVQAGEVSVISLAAETGSIVIMDDELGRIYAAGLGVVAFHSTFLIIRAVAKNAVSKRDAMGFIDRMIEGGWRCDVETYKEILTKITSM